MCDGSVDTDGIKTDGCGDDPEGRRSKGLGDGLAYFSGDILILMRGRTFADESCGEWKADHKGEYAESQVGTAPSHVRDHGLRQHRKHDGPEPASRQHDGESESSPAVEPCGDGAGVSDVSSAVAHQANDEKREIEMQQVRCEQGQ